MYIKRSLEDEVEPFLRRKEVIAILGPRQAGKTTFLQHLAQKMEKAGEIGEDFKYKANEDLQKLVDEYNGKIEEVEKKKEAELMS